MQRMLLVLGSLCLVSACVSQPIKGSEEKVRIVSADHGCDVIGTVTDAGSLAIPRSRGGRHAHSVLQTKASEMGANAVYVVSTTNAVVDAANGSSSTLGGSTRVVGHALRCDEQEGEK